MYFCPHPRRYGGGTSCGRGRQQITPPCARPLVPPILHPPLAPPLVRPSIQPPILAPIPPLPQACNNDPIVNVLELLKKEEEKEVNEKGKGKMETLDAMPIEGTRFNEDERIREVGPSQSKEGEAKC